MTRFKSSSRQAVGLVFSHNEYGLVHESVKATIKSFKDNLIYYVLHKKILSRYFLIFIDLSQAIY